MDFRFLMSKARKARRAATKWFQSKLNNNSVQLGISAKGTFTPTAFSEYIHGVFARNSARDEGDTRTVCLESGSALTAQIKSHFEQGWNLISVMPMTENYPVVRGRVRLYVSMKPRKMILDEHLTVTFSNAKMGDSTLYMNVPDASDLKLFNMFVGAKNCFPTAPDQLTGISGCALSRNVVGNGVNLPSVKAGEDVVFGCAVQSSALCRISPPEGYTIKDLVSVQVHAVLNLFGEELP